MVMVKPLWGAMSLSRPLVVMVRARLGSWGLKKINGFKEKFTELTVFANGLDMVVTKRVGNG